MPEEFKFSKARLSCRYNFATNGSTPEDVPIVVALHGGTYTSQYFEVPGHSLFARAAALGIPFVAVDRPGYAGTEVVDARDLTQAGNAEILNDLVMAIWDQEGRARRGIVLIGHSIGGAVALRIAASQPSWPLLGVAVSGVGLRLSANGAEPRELPPIPYIDVPSAIKDQQMFGPVGTFSRTMPDASRIADAPAPRQDLIDIVSTWPREAATVLAAIKVPVHYRQGEHDNLWTVNGEEVHEFAAACAAAPWLDAGIVDHAGHCIDFHRVGASFQLEQLAFALRCAAMENVSF